MKAIVETYNHYKKDDWFFVIMPTLSVGYCENFFSISLYILNWELSLNFIFGEL